jgi:hypothetical protein
MVDQEALKRIEAVEAQVGSEAQVFEQMRFVFEGR